MTLQTQTLDVVIGNRVAAARKARELIAADVAPKLGLSYAEYLACEAGQKRFRSRDLSILARLFTIEVRSFFEDKQFNSERTDRLNGFALADWIETSRNREGLRALLQSEHLSTPDPQTEKAA